jgi:hypothetical protein
VEDATDRAQLFHVLRRGAPAGEHLFEVADLFFEFLEEDLADFVVDFIAGGFEATACAGGDRSGGDGHGRGCDRRGRGRHHGRGGRRFDAHVGGGRVELRRFHGRLRRRRIGEHRRLRRFVRQRPVAQRLQALARDVEDVVAVGPLVAQRFEVVLDARQRVGQRVELLAVGHAAAAEQFVLGEAAHAGQVLRRLREFEDAQRAGDLFEQARHVGQLCVVPAGFHEGDEGLARIGEVGDRFAHEHVEHLARFARDGVGFLAFGRTAQAIDLVVVHGVALLQHHVARHAQAHHAERVGGAAQRFHLRMQVGHAGLLGAQVQVQRVFHAQQVFLDRGGDRVEQRAVASAEAAAGVREFGFGRQLRREVEGVAQRVERAVRLFVVRHVVEQLARGFGARIHAHRGGGLAFEDVARFALHAREGLAQRARGRQRAVAQRGGHRGGDPQHAARGFVVGAFQQAVDGLGDAADVRGRAVFRPRRQRFAQRGELLRGHELAALARQRHRRGQRIGQRAVEVRDEQDAFAQPGLAARGAQLVEQRQQDDRNVLVAALQALEVVGQEHHAAHQRAAGFVAVGDGALGALRNDQRVRQAFHFLRDHRRCVELHHAQRAVHLVQEAGAGAHQGGVGRILREGLDFPARLAQGLVDLRLDPAERGGVDGVAQRGHAK